MVRRYSVAFMEDNMNDKTVDNAIGEKYRKKLGLGLTMRDAMEIPHPYEGGSFCIACGLSPKADVHIVKEGA